jgi:hypothetical protein
MASPLASDCTKDALSLIVPSASSSHETQQKHQHQQLRSATKTRSLSSLSSILLSEGREDTATKVLRSRSGQVLGKNTILKSDNYSLHQAKDDREIVPISGAPNFRRVCIRKGPTLYGVAQPTTFGIAGVVNFIISTEVSKSSEGVDSSPSPLLSPFSLSSVPTFIWVNLREE